MSFANSLGEVSENGYRLLSYLSWLSEILFSMNNWKERLPAARGHICFQDLFSRMIVDSLVSSLFLCLLDIPH